MPSEAWIRREKRDALLRRKEELEQHRYLTANKPVWDNDQAEGLYKDVIRRLAKLDAEAIRRS